LAFSRKQNKAFRFWVPVMALASVGALLTFGTPTDGVGAGCGGVSNDVGVESNDGNDPIAELSDLGSLLHDGDTENGGSIRGKLNVGSRNSWLDDPETLRVKVLRVEQGSFPFIAFEVKVIRAAAEGLGSQFEQNDVFTMVPAYSYLDGGKIDFNQPTNLLNMVSYYFAEHDTVFVQLVTGRDDFPYYVGNVYLYRR
jgi:hypothetical protein